jgi:hypothetical protein
MKRGGVGYVQADPKSFPLLADMNEFCLACGAIPTITWLNGLSEGERQIERLVEVQMETGAAALNIIPDRNYTPGVDDEKLRNLYDVVELAEKLGLPVVCGTEMNSPGQKFVDSFETDELKPLIPVFLKGAHIVYAHQILQRHCGIGYLSGWASGNFKSVSEKNDFYETVGRRLVPERIDAIRRFNEQSGPQEILTTIESGI